MRGQKCVVKGVHARLRRAMDAYAPRIHPLCIKIFTKMDGLHRNSGLPELRSIIRRKSGEPDLRVKPGNDDPSMFENHGAFSSAALSSAASTRSSAPEGCSSPMRARQSRSSPDGADAKNPRASRRASRGGEAAR